MPDTGDLFAHAAAKDTSQAPLAERLRPRDLDEMVGQQRILGQGRALRRLLEPEHQVTVVTSGRAALAELAAAKPAYDLILCDLMMPEITGAEVYETVTRERPELATRFVIMTGGAFTAHGQQFLAETDVPVLEKPFDLETLRSLVRSRLAT